MCLCAGVCVCLHVLDKCMSAVQERARGELTQIVGMWVSVWEHLLAEADTSGNGCFEKRSSAAAVS